MEYQPPLHSPRDRKQERTGSVLTDLFIYSSTRLQHGCRSKLRLCAWASVWPEPSPHLAGTLMRREKTGWRRMRLANAFISLRRRGPGMEGISSYHRHPCRNCDRVRRFEVFDLRSRYRPASGDSGRNAPYQNFGRVATAVAGAARSPWTPLAGPPRPPKGPPAPGILFIRPLNAHEHRRRGLGSRRS